MNYQVRFSGQQESKFMLPIINDPSLQYSSTRHWCIQKRHSIDTVEVTHLGLNALPLLLTGSLFPPVSEPPSCYSACPLRLYPPSALRRSALANPCTRRRAVFRAVCSQQPNGSFMLRTPQQTFFLVEDLLSDENEILFCFGKDIRYILSVKFWTSKYSWLGNNHRTH